MRTTGGVTVVVEQQRVFELQWGGCHSTCTCALIWLVGMPAVWPCCAEGVAMPAVLPCSADGDHMRAAMRAAMRPAESHAAARDTVVRAVEQGAALLTAPRDGVTAVMQVGGWWDRVASGIRWLVGGWWMAGGCLVK